MAKRMFTAIELPPQVTHVLAALDPRLTGLRWMPPSMQHLTLAFLAAVPEESIRPWIEALEQIDMPPFQLGLRGLGSFGRRDHPSVLWAGIDKPPPELDQLQGRVRDAVLAAGLEMDEKPFHPHVTVARCKGTSKRQLIPWFEAHKDRNFGSFEVTGFTLFASELHPDGARHERVFRRDFGQP